MSKDDEFKDALARWDKKLEPLVRANRESEMLTGEDMTIIIGPHCDEVEK